MRSSRQIVLVVATVVLGFPPCNRLVSAEADCQLGHEFPMWDGRETTDEYARRIGLPPSMQLCLTNGAVIELVLIPASTFVIGEPKPTPSYIGNALLIFGVIAVVCIVIRMIAQALRERKRPQLSTVWAILLLCSLGLSFGGLLLWVREISLKYLYYYKAQQSERQTSIRAPYYIGKHKVTKAQYALQNSNPSIKDGVKWGVSCDEAEAFCLSVTESCGVTVRLPSEEEWVFAARAGLPENCLERRDGEIARGAGRQWNLIGMNDGPEFCRGAFDAEGAQTRLARGAPGDRLFVSNSTRYSTRSFRVVAEVPASMQRPACSGCSGCGGPSVKGESK
jgi:hypothetical protein